MHYVYTIYGHEGEALYVGCTDHVTRRVEQHGRRRRRWKYINRVEVAEYPSKRLALWAEARRIFDLQPEWNKLGKSKIMPAGRSLADYELQPPYGS